MARWRELSVGDLADILARHRPFILVAVGVLLVVLVPGPAEEARTRLDGRTHDAPGPPGEHEAFGEGETFPVNEDAAAAAQTGEKAGRGSHEASERPPATITGDALQAPDCDPVTGRTKVQATGLMPAPNCVPMWPESADNGGATFPGVTGDTITVSLYQTPFDPSVTAIAAAAGAQDGTSEEEENANRGMVLEAFQAHYETYGREIRWVKVQPSGTASDEAAAKADAIRIATDVKAFANMDDPSRAGGPNTFVEELAARKIVCIPCTSMQPHWNLESLAPYVFNDRVSADGMLMHTAEFVGKRVGPGAARWAGDPLLAAQQRRYGLIHVNTADDSYRGVDAVLDRELPRYGLRLVAKTEYLFDAAQAQENARVSIARMKDAGVTTLICWCEGITTIFFTREATRQQYFPEWVITGATGLDIAVLARLYDQSQWKNAFGVGWVAPPVVASEPNLVEWHCGCELSSYPELQSWSMLFTGIHLAGPNLTPETFRDGLFSLKPVIGHLTRVGVSFGNHGFWPWTDYQSFDDTTELWWDPAARDARGNTGLYRFVDMGRRYGLNARPALPTPLFDTANSITEYAERPAQDRRPPYEHRHYR